LKVNKRASGRLKDLSDLENLPYSSPHRANAFHTYSDFAYRKELR
jgi:hypothetical protein